MTGVLVHHRKWTNWSMVKNGNWLLFKKKYSYKQDFLGNISVNTKIHSILLKNTTPICSLFAASATGVNHICTLCSTVSMIFVKLKESRTIGPYKNLQ